MPKKKLKTRKEIIKEDVSKYAKLESLKNSAGGKDLIVILEKDFMSSIDQLLSKYKKGTEGLVPVIARMDLTLNLLRMLSRTSKNKELALEALKDEEKRELEES